MATVKKVTDKSVPDTHRAVKFTSDSVTSDFAQDDYIDVYGSLGRSAARMEIACASDAAVTVKFNALQMRYGLLDRTNGQLLPAPDLQNGTEFENDNAYEQVVSNGQTFILTDIPIRNLKIASLTVGTGDGVVISFR